MRACRKPLATVCAPLYGVSCSSHQSACALCWCMQRYACHAHGPRNRSPMHRLLMACSCGRRAQTDILDHKEQQAGVAAKRTQALEAQLDASRGELARSVAQAATLTVHPPCPSRPSRAVMAARCQWARCARSWPAAPLFSRYNPALILHTARFGKRIQGAGAQHRACRHAQDTNPCLSPVQQ